MFDLISVGAVGIDLYFKGESLTHSKERFELAIGGKYFTDHFYEGLGGGGANVAIGVRKHGLKTALFSEIGNNPFKKILLDKLAKDKVVYEHFCHFEDQYMNISAILLTENGEKTIINYRTPHQHLISCDHDLERLINSQAIYLANMPNISLTERYRILTLAKKHKVLTIVNLGVVDCRRPKKQLKEFLKKIDMLIINGHEFADLVKAPYHDIDWRENVVHYYLPDFQEKLMIITNGVKGSYAYMKSHRYYQEAVKPAKIIDATGAGDGYSAGFIGEYLKTADIKRSMNSGANYATKILAKIGAN